MNLFNLLKQYFRAQTPLEMVVSELAVAQLAKLEAETAVDFAVSVVLYNDNRITRLNKHIVTYQEANQI